MAKVNIIEYITIASTGNATDFGNLSTGTDAAASCSNSTRNITGGGEESYPSGGTDRIQYVTIASTGNSTDFGDLTIAMGNHSSGSSTTRGIWAGGIQWGVGDTNVISYVKIKMH